MVDDKEMLVEVPQLTDDKDMALFEVDLYFSIFSHSSLFYTSIQEIKRR